MGNKDLQVTKKMTITGLINKSVMELGKALPAHMNPERMVRIALTTLRMTPKLMECDPLSFLGALFSAAQLGLEPNIEGQAYIIPYGNEAVFQIGYKGYVELFYRHQSALSLDMQEVRENDDFRYKYGTESFINHTPALKDRGEVIAYYAVAKMKDGAYAFKVMSKGDCMAHGKKHSKAFSKPASPWQTEPDAMCKKTVLIQLMKLIPKSIEIQSAIALDETIKRGVAANMLDVKDITDWNNDPAKKAVAGKPMVEQPKAKSEEEKRKKMLELFEIEQKRAGDEEFFGQLGKYGYTTVAEIPTLLEARAICAEMKKLPELIKKTDPKAKKKTKSE